MLSYFLFDGKDSQVMSVLQNKSVNLRVHSLHIS